MVLLVKPVNRFTKISSVYHSPFTTNSLHPAQQNLCTPEPIYRFPTFLVMDSISFPSPTVSIAPLGNNTHRSAPALQSHCRTGIKSLTPGSHQPSISPLRQLGFLHPPRIPCATIMPRSSGTTVNSKFSFTRTLPISTILLPFPW